MRASLARAGGVLAGLVVGVGLGLAAPYVFRWVTTPRALDPAAAASLEYRRFKDDIRRHHASPGPSWSAEATSLFRSDLNAAAQKTGATIVNVDCRGVTCYVELKWPTRAAAMSGADRLVREPLRPHCSPKIMLPPPDVADGAAELLARC